MFVRQNDFLLVLYRDNVWVILRLRVQIPRGATFYRKGNFLFFNQLFAFRFQIKGRAKHGSKVLGRKNVIMTQKVAKQKNKNRGDCVCLRWGMCRVVFLNKTHFSLLILFFLKVWYISFFVKISVIHCSDVDFSF